MAILVGSASPAAAQSLSAFVVDEGADTVLRYDDFTAAPEEVISSTDAGNPARIALDPVNGYFYWTDVGSGSDGRILRARRSGAAVEAVLTGLDNPAGLAVDTENGKLYWTDSQANTISRSDLDGSNAETLISASSDVHAPVDIQVDLQNDRIYWANGGDEGSSNGSLGRAALDGTGAELILTARANPIGVALDVNGGKVYWAERGAGEVLRADLDGSNEETIASGTFPLGLSLDLVDDKVYWTVYQNESTPGEIRRADLAGTSPETVRDDLDRPLGLAVNTDPPLPVELVAFTGRSDRSSVVLTWSTASEQQNAGFAIQHAPKGSLAGKQASTGGGDAGWTHVGWVEGAGTTRSAQQYTFRVDGLRPGTHRFRLKQLDLDGTTTFSPEVEVSVRPPQGVTLSAPYPNPTQGMTRVDYDVPRDGLVEISVHDVLGRRVQTVVAQAQPAGQHTATIDTAQLPSGLYFVRLAAGSTVRHAKVSVAR
jgi:DNA-binding beta-propeller fold protein YncE